MCPLSSERGAALTSWRSQRTEVGVQWLDFSSECMTKDYQGAIKCSLTGHPLLTHTGTNKTSHHILLTTAAFENRSPQPSALQTHMDAYVKALQFIFIQLIYLWKQKLQPSDKLTILMF